MYWAGRRYALHSSLWRSVYAFLVLTLLTGLYQSPVFLWRLQTTRPYLRWPLHRTLDCLTPTNCTVYLIVCCSVSEQHLTCNKNSSGNLLSYRPHNCLCLDVICWRARGLFLCTVWGVKESFCNVQVFWLHVMQTTFHCQVQLSLLPSAGREMSSSYGSAMGWRPSMADWGNGVSASCTVGPTVR